MNIISKFEKYIYFFIFTILLLSSKSYCRYSFGLCQTLKYETEIKDLKPYLGKWYEIIRSKTTPFEKGNCATAEYSINEKGNIKIENTENRQHLVTKAHGVGKLTNDNNRLKLFFDDSIWNYFFPGDYRIVKTDFKTYSIVYSCSQYLFMKFELVWVLVRDPHKLEQSRIDEWTQFINDNFSFNPEELFYTKHDPVSCKTSSGEGKAEI